MFNTLGRPNVTYVAILITDGEVRYSSSLSQSLNFDVVGVFHSILILSQNNYGMDPFPVADTMKASGITIFGIAVILFFRFVSFLFVGSLISFCFFFSVRLAILSTSLQLKDCLRISLLYEHPTTAIS